MSRSWPLRPCSREPLGSGLRPHLLHPLGGIASVSVNALQQGPHLRRTVDSTAQVSADNNILHVVIMTRGSMRLRRSLCWGKKWGKVPHRFQPIST